jgi:hypothetical protein
MVVNEPDSLCSKVFPTQALAFRTHNCHKSFRVICKNGLMARQPVLPIPFSRYRISSNLAWVRSDHISLYCLSCEGRSHPLIMFIFSTISANSAPPLQTVRPPVEPNLPKACSNHQRKKKILFLRFQSQIAGLKLQPGWFAMCWRRYRRAL